MRRKRDDISTHGSGVQFRLEFPYFTANVPEVLGLFAIGTDERLDFGRDVLASLDGAAKHQRDLLDRRGQFVGRVGDLFDSDGDLADGGLNLGLFIIDGCGVLNRSINVFYGRLDALDHLRRVRAYLIDDPFDGLDLLLVERTDVRFGFSDCLRFDVLVVHIFANDSPDPLCTGVDCRRLQANS